MPPFYFMFFRMKIMIEVSTVLGGGKRAAAGGGGEDAKSKLTRAERMENVKIEYELAKCHLDHRSQHVFALAANQNIVAFANAVYDDKVAFLRLLEPVGDVWWFSNVPELVPTREISFHTVVSNCCTFDLKIVWNYISIFYIIQALKTSHI